MAQEPDYSYLLKESYDIFLCTRGLPDALTAETAALRQLMSALVGGGYKVFFPSALPQDVPQEILAGAMAAAVRSAKVMIAAAVGDEGAQDPTARFLWKRFREMAAQEPECGFIACLREVSAVPEELAGAQTLDMGALDFLSELNALLSQTLPRSAPGPEEEEVPPEETATPEVPTEPDKRRRRLFLTLAVAVGVLALLGLAVLLFTR